jgi:hypothetical protein
MPPGLSLASTAALPFMLPWLLTALTLASVLISAPVVGGHRHADFGDQPQPRWNRRMQPIGNR